VPWGVLSWCVPDEDKIKRQASALRRAQFCLSSTVRRANSESGRRVLGSVRGIIGMRGTALLGSKGSDSSKRGIDVEVIILCIIVICAIILVKVKELLLV
jgi:hypothetical protein